MFHLYPAGLGRNGKRAGKTWSAEARSTRKKAPLHLFRQHYRLYDSGGSHRMAEIGLEALDRDIRKPGKRNCPGLHLVIIHRGRAMELDCIDFRQ